MTNDIPRPKGRIVALAGITVGVVIAASSVAAAVLASGSSPADTTGFRDSTGVERVRVGDQGDGSTGVKVSDSGGNTIYDFTKAPSATTVGGLGSGTYDGEPGYLRVGSSPYESVHLTWDATRSKWISEKFPVAQVVGPTTNYLLTSTSYGGLPGGYETRSTIPNFKALYDAGLRPEGDLVVDMFEYTAGETIYSRLRLGSFTSGDITPQTPVATGTELSSSSSGCTYFDTGWEPLTIANAPTGQTGYAVVDFRVSGGQGFVCPGVGGAWLRWTS